MNVLLVRSKDGALTVHKDTCKKIIDRETYEVEEYISANPALLTTAKKASCCKPSDALMEEVQQAGWDAVNEAPEDPATDGDEEPEGEEPETESLDDLIGVDFAVDGDDDLIGEVEAAKPKAAPKPKTERAADGLASLKAVAAHLGLDLGKKPVFPGYGKAFKTEKKQSVYVNSKGTADARAVSAEQAEEWASLDHVERRSGNYVRVNLRAL